MNRDERLKVIRAENEARYQRGIAEREDCGIAYISLAPIEEIKEQLTNLQNQPIEIKEA